MCSRFGWISSKPPHCFSDTIEVSSSKHVKSVERWKWNVKKWENPSKNSAHFPFYFTKKGIIWRKSRKCDFLRLSLFVLLERSRETWNLCALRGKISPSHDTREGEQGSDFVTKWTHKKVGKNNSRQEDEGEEGKKSLLQVISKQQLSWVFPSETSLWFWFHSNSFTRNFAVDFPIFIHFSIIQQTTKCRRLLQTVAQRNDAKQQQKNFLLLFPPLQMIFIFRSSWELRKTKQVRRKKFTVFH